MNLNEFLVNKKKPKGVRYTANKRNSNAVYSVNKIPMGPPPTPPLRKKSTPSSDLIWGKSHISVPNTTSSSAKKSRSSSKVSSEEPENKVIVALTEGRGGARCEVGIAAVDVTRPLIVLCQISDTQSYVNTLTKINIINPNEILVPTTFVDTFTENRLVTMIRKQFPKMKISGIPRSTFNKINGLETLSSLCVPSLNGILLILQHRYYALAAASALITHIQESLFIYYAKGTIKIEYQESEGYAVIDTSTADRLELVCSTKPAQANRYSSLFGILNHCCTKIGTRTLRSSILRPPCKVEYIEERLECVTELALNPEARLSIQALLQKVPNIDMILGIATILSIDPEKCSNRQLNYVLLLNSLLDMIAPLKDVISKLKMPFFVRLRKTLEDEGFEHIRKCIREMLSEGAHPAKGSQATMQRCFAIKCGINGLLDLIRKTYTERLNDLQVYTKQLSEKYGLPLTLSSNQTKGFHFVLPLKGQQKRTLKKSDLPDEFIEVQRLVGSFTMKTPELVNYSTRLDDIMTDILKISDVLVHKLIVYVKQYVHLFYTLCEQVAYLDMLQSLAETSSIHGYVRPSFGNLTEVTFARHPLLDFLLPTRPVSNPISCSEDFNVHIITGPNGSGKSIFIRQVMLLQVMAQVGCYVPAQSAMFKPADLMFARIYLDDNMEYGASSFVLEMKEMNYVMSTITSNSLVIIDELCRSTSVKEGTALAIAIVEKLLQSSAFVYVTTHFVLLTKLYDIYPNVKIWQMETVPIGDDPRSFKLHYKYSLLPGVTSVRQYGVYIVRNIWPDYVMKWVDEILQKITKKPKAIDMATLDPKCRLKYTIESEFRRLKNKQELTVRAINDLLITYQNELFRLGYNINIQPFTERTLQQLPCDQPTMNNYVGENNIQDLRHQEIDLQREYIPEQSIQSQEANEAIVSQEKWREVFTPDSSLYDDTPQDSQYGEVSRFIAEDPQNIFKLMPDVSIHEEDGSTMPQGKCIEGDSRIKTSVGSTSTTIVRRYDGMRTFPSSSHTEESSLPVQSKICLNYDFYHEQQHNLTSDELESIKEDLEICSQMLVDDDDFNEAKYVDRNTFQDQTFDIPIDETFTKTHKQQNDVSDPDDDHYNNFAANISKHGQIADVSMTNTYTEYYNAGQQPIYEINEERTIENEFKRLMSSEEIEVCKDNVPQPQSNIFPETSPQINDPQFLSKIRPENAERYNLTNIQFEENTILPKPSKHKKPNYFSKIKKCEGGKNMDQTREKVADKNEGNTFAKPNTYKYYLSPILVNVIEGPDEKTLSIEEDDSSTKEPFVQPGEIDILEHIILTPKGTLISAVNKAQGHRISGDVVAENLDVQNVDQNYDIDNREVCVDTEIRETDEAGYDEDITSEDANSQENIRAVQHDNKLKQSYKETEFGKDPVTCEIAAVDQDESFESIACSQNKVTEKASDALDQSTASFKSVTGRSTDYESAHDQFNIEVQMSSAQPVKIIARFVSCDDEGDAKEQMTHIGIDNIGGRDIPEGKSYMKDNHNTETNNKVEDEKLVIIKDHTSSESGDKKESSIGVTDASRMRNLDNCTDTSEDSKTVTEDTKFHTSCGSTSSDKKRSSPVTSVSSASKKRNLDHVTDTTTITIMENDHASESTITPRESSNTSNLKNDESKSTTGEGNFNIVTKQKKMTKRKKIPQDQSKTESSLNSKLTKPNSKVTKKFIPPRKLSAKEIREEFEMQDNKLFELTKSTPNSSDMSKYLERLMNRPRVKEVQNTTHLALIRKTEQGVEVIPAEPSKPRKRKQTALRKHFSNENVDMSMFSDKNARCFEKFLDSDERNYSSFRFNFQKTESAFKFDQIEMKAGEYTDGSITMSFTRKTSETSEKPMFKPDFNLENQSTSGGFNFQGFKTEMSKTDIKCGQYSQSDRSGITSFVRKASNMSMEQSQMTFKPDFSMSGIHNQTFTPDGYFKQNKDDITNILNKYRQLSSQDTAIGGRSRNIFESSDSINCEEFKL